MHRGSSPIQVDGVRAAMKSLFPIRLTGHRRCPSFPMFALYFFAFFFTMMVER